MNGTDSIIRNCYVHHCFQEGLGFEVFDEDSGVIQNLSVTVNVVEYYNMGIIAINWDEKQEENHYYSNVTVSGNYTLYSVFAYSLSHLVVYIGNYGVKSVIPFWIVANFQKNPRHIGEDSF